jgi:hypothetical protein
MGLDQTKTLLHSKGTNRVKRQVTEWEKILASSHLTEGYPEHTKNSKFLSTKQK